jgi:hypothetical protein
MVKNFCCKGDGTVAEALFNPVLSMVPIGEKWRADFRHETSLIGNVGDASHRTTFPPLLAPAFTGMTNGDSFRIRFFLIMYREAKWKSM